MVDTIRLTATEVELVQWALDPMDDYWCRADATETINPAEPRGQSGQAIIPADQLPRIVDGQLILSTRTDVNEDLCYRLLDQLDDMTREQLAGEVRPGDGRPWADTMLTARAIKSLRRKLGRFYTGLQDDAD